MINLIFDLDPLVEKWFRRAWQFEQHAFLYLQSNICCIWN